MWSIWCRALVGGLLLALGASLEIYDQPANEELMYLDVNDIDPGSGRVGDVMMQKLIRDMQLQRLTDVGLPNSLNLSPLEEAKRHMDQVLMPEMTYFKDPVFKRLAQPANPAPTRQTLKPDRPQQKWKLNKGKTGQTRLCLLKLCSLMLPPA